MLLAAAPAAAQPREPIHASRWRVSELRFTAEADHTDPFDFERARFVAEMTGPDGVRLVVPGFWDGERNWVIRFTPTAEGRWDYVTAFSDASDHGLHGVRGSVDAGGVTGETALRKHGGFLRLGEGRHHLVHTDGSPFFWLGDTWWRVPSSYVPFDDFTRMVDRRVAQGFTVFQALGYAPFAGTRDVGVFAAVRAATDAALRYWREVDRYFAYAEAKGLVGVVGLGGTAAFDRADLGNLRRLWHYYLARYGAYPITFLITQEYNARSGDPAARFAKVRELGRLIREIDPYGRAISVHPAVASIDDHRVWSEDWYGFAMLQAGHFSRVDCNVLERLRRKMPIRPIVQAEHNYEGFERGTVKVTAEEIRRTAYTTLQCGAYGYTYGAQGLYAAVNDTVPTDPTSKWGPVTTWKVALDFEGAAQLQHLRAFYESTAWWKLVPWPRGRATGGIFASFDGDGVIVVYYEATTADRREALLYDVPEAAAFDYDWFDPRTGRFLETRGSVAAKGRKLTLPPAPSRGDWLLRLRAHR